MYLTINRPGPCDRTGDRRVCAPVIVHVYMRADRWIPRLLVYDDDHVSGADLYGLDGFFKGFLLAKCSFVYYIE